MEAKQFVKILLNHPPALSTAQQYTAIVDLKFRFSAILTRYTEGFSLAKVDFALLSLCGCNC